MGKCEGTIMAGRITALQIRWSDRYVTSDGQKDEDGFSGDDGSGGAWFDWDSTNDYGLRVAFWSDSGTSANKIEETVDFTRGNGSGFRATVVYSRNPSSGTATFDSSGNLVINGEGRVQLDFSWDDVSSDLGTALGTVEYSDLGVSFTQSSSTTGSDTSTKLVDTGTYNVSFTDMNSRGFVRQNSNTTLCFRDDGGSDCNATLTATFIPGEPRVKIRIKSIQSYGTGYSVGDVLSTTRWENWPGAVNRILRVDSVIVAPTASLTASPTSLTAGAGGSSTLTWSSGGDRSSYTLTDDNGNTIVASPGASGSFSVSPTVTTTYTYTVTGPDGDVASDTATVTVSNAATPTADLTVSPNSITLIGGTPSGTPVLRWDSTNGSSYTLTDDNGNTIVANPGSTGNITVNPTVTTTYTYTVTNISGITVEDTATVTVSTIEIPTASLTATPSSIELGSGQTSTLRWSSSNANTYTLTGEANPGASGSKVVQPVVTTTYTYTVTGEGGTATSNATVTVTVPAVPTASLSANPTSLISGECSTLSWSSTGGTSFSLTDVANPGSSGAATVCPTSTKTYRYDVSNAGGSTFDSLSITVYDPPGLTINANPGTTITTGGSVTIEWSTTGDADRIVWLQGGITNLNLNSFQVVSPTSTTTYSAYVSGLGGTSSTVSVTIIVYQIPTLTVDYPTGIPYNTQANVEYTSNYVDGSLTLTPTYYYLNDVVVTGDTVTLTSASSAESGVGITEVTDTYTTTIPYNSTGPISVVLSISGTGSGGVVSSSATIPIVVDTTPENLSIEDSVDLLIDQTPVVTPDTDVLSNQYLIDDIDIDVEIKSDYPIQVQLNNSGTWENVREL